MVIGFVSDEMFVAIADAQLEFKKIAEANFTNELNLFNNKFTNNEHTGS